MCLMQYCMFHWQTCNNPTLCASSAILQQQPGMVFFVSSLLSMQYYMQHLPHVVWFQCNTPTPHATQPCIVVCFECSVVAATRGCVPCFQPKVACLDWLNQLENTEHQPWLLLQYCTGRTQWCMFASETCNIASKTCNIAFKKSLKLAILPVLAIL